MSLLFNNFRVSVHEDEEDDKIVLVFWKLVGELLRVVLSCREGFVTLVTAKFLLFLFGSMSLFMV